jgi:hypothetical protein
MGYARWVVYDDKDISGLLLEQKDTQTRYLENAQKVGYGPS